MDGLRGRDTRTVRFFDFEHPEGSLNEFVVTTQFRVRRSNERDGTEDDERLVIPDLVLFVNGIPLVVMEAKSPSLAGRVEVASGCASCAVTRRPGRSGRAGVRRSCSTTTCCAWPTAGPQRPTRPWAPPENAYFEWKWLGPYSDDDIRQRFGVEPQGQARLLSACCLRLRCWTSSGTTWCTNRSGGGCEETAPVPAVPGGAGGHVPHPRPEASPPSGGASLWHTQGSGKSLTMFVAGHQDTPGAATGQHDHRGGHRPHSVGQADCRHLRTLRLPGPERMDRFPP